ncbi:hypothetical protein A3L04_08480 [Thermococcus chitonophagus]|uniref:Restriction endonuclease n=1 Tax=Thermococcus chitonophagus TaxID=54262 RepID=A0A160VT94_9EURY|nr:hypothetical protein [Thermococcus chitonophagus]ASJ17101.1 hypothetical protein A3L04_08480 [Thermococcus chitonophagus]CUX77706.1 hypothetical protein CHITON_0927 [Thermococcus chitonophagus]
MKTIDLFEFVPIFYSIGGDRPTFQEDTKTLVLPEKLVRELDKINEKLQFLDITLKTIKPKNKVGVFSFKGLTLQIFPKLLRTKSYEELERSKSLVMGNLLKMLSIAGDIPITDADIASVSLAKADFLEVLIRIYACGLLSILKSHRYYQYMHRHDELRYVKGQINFQKYSLHPARRHIIPCNFNDKFIDNPLNRTLKYAAYLMSRITESPDNYRMLKNIMSIFDSVSLVPISLEEIERIHFHRLNKIFKPYVELAKIFIQNSIVKLQYSKIETFTFLIPMEKLFEKFVTNTIISNKEKVLTEEFQDAKIIPQHEIGYLLMDREYSRGYFKLIPDITIEVQGKRYVIDLKYKLLTKEEKKLGVSQSDLYQMYAYATKWNADGVLLIYPTLEEHVEKEWHFEVETRTGRKDIPLIIRTINLNHNLLKNEGWENFLLELSQSLTRLIQTN